MIDQRLEATAGEFARYAIVGIASNGVLFVFYLLLTGAGLEPKLAATIAYGAGVLQTFVFNRSWSFRHAGARGPALGRYIVAYASGYVLNMAVLATLVDGAGLPHQWVQGITILALAALLFLLQKFWVFRDKESR
jgi:putative flippase GtrA